MKSRPLESPSEDAIERAFRPSSGADRKVMPASYWAYERSLRPRETFLQLVVGQGHEPSCRKSLGCLDPSSGVGVP